VDGAAVASLPMFAQTLLLHKSGELVHVEILRGSNRMTLAIHLTEQDHKQDRLADLADPARDFVRPLSILGIEVDDDVARSMPDLRSPSGVVVVARTLGSGTEEVPLQLGDVIHGVNGSPITTLDGLRKALAAQKPGDAVVLQIERYGQLMYIAFSL
jgi:serine protease Do